MVTKSQRMLALFALASQRNIGGKLPDDPKILPAYPFLRGEGRKKFRKYTHPDTLGSPVCPRCGQRRAWAVEHEGRKRWRCRDDGTYFDIKETTNELEREEMGDRADHVDDPAAVPIRLEDDPAGSGRSGGSR